jgi:transcriptional regulator
MYVPAHFAAADSAVLALLSSGGAAHLVTPAADGLAATFLPLLYSPAGAARDAHGQSAGAAEAGADQTLVGGSLLGHVARNNPHWQVATRANGESLAIVNGPDAYISPSWYASKAEHGRVVPTWNYLSVQVFGRLVVHEDTDWLRGLVTRLTDVHEAGMPAPWSVTDAPETFIDGQLRAIVGLELVITRVEAKAKFSQNRSAADRAGVRAALGDGFALDPDPSG